MKKYPKNGSIKHQQRAYKFSQDELLDTEDKETKTDKPVMVTTYNPSNPDKRIYTQKLEHYWKHRRTQRNLSRKALNLIQEIIQSQESSDIQHSGIPTKTSKQAKGGRIFEVLL